MTHQGDPEFLYKYRTVDTIQALERVRAILIQHQLWFSAADDFNDPYDCAPIVRTPLNRQRMIGIASRVAARETEGKGRAQRRLARRENLVRIKRMNYSPEQVEQINAGILAMIRRDTGVFSLSADAASVLMWSHYAQSHTGVCLRFRLDVNSEIRDAVGVRYSVERPTVDFLGDPMEMATKALLHKADYWSYEDDYRIVKPDGVGRHGFPPLVLDGIIFGAKISAENEASVRQAAQIGNVGQHLFRAQFDDQDFRLNIVPA
jgi:hypothetical protein